MRKTAARSLRQKAIDAMPAEIQGPDELIILCGANAYEEKYYFNPLFDRIPESVKEELRTICVLFTQEAGGILTIGFTPDGDVTIQTRAEEEDITYDEISAGLLVGEIRRKRAQLLEELSLFYRAIILRQDISALLTEDEDA